MTGMTENRVLRRRVFHVAGYDPAPPSAVFERFARELRRFERAWGVRTTISELAVDQDLATWHVSASGPNWRTETEINLVRWDDVIINSGGRPAWDRLAMGLVAFCDFLVSGAFLGYLRASWRYAMFFLYPFLMLFSIVALSLGVSVLFGNRVGLIGGIAAFLVTALPLLYIADRWMFLGFLLEDWIFARQYTRHGDHGLAERLDRVAAVVADEGRTGRPDEIVVVGHSLGAVLAIELIDRATNIQAEQGEANRKLVFLSVGASILKIGLHRAARGFRAAIKRVSSNRDVFWVDYRARSDVINFYGAELLAHLNLPAAKSPLVRNVSIRRMIAPERYPRIRKNWYKMHCQFVRGNDRRAPYDYFMATCGPIPAERSVQSERGVMDSFGVDGELLDQADIAEVLKAVGTAKS